MSFEDAPKERIEAEDEVRQEDTLIPIELEVHPAEAEALHWFNERIKSTSKKNCTKCRGTGVLHAWGPEGWNKKKLCPHCRGTGSLAVEVKLKRVRTIQRNRTRRK